MRQGEEEIPPEDEQDDMELVMQDGDEDALPDDGCGFELLLEVLAEMEDEDLYAVLAAADAAQMVDASQPILGKDNAEDEAVDLAGQLLQAEQGGNGKEVVLEDEVLRSSNSGSKMTCTLMDEKLFDEVLATLELPSRDGADMEVQGDGLADGACASRAPGDVVVVPDTQCLWNGEEKPVEVWEVPDTQADQVAPSQSVGVDDHVCEEVDGKEEVGVNGEACESVAHDEVCGDAVCTPELRRSGCKLLSPLILGEDSWDAEIRDMLDAGLISDKDIMAAMMHEGLLVRVVV